MSNILNTLKNKSKNKIKTMVVVSSCNMCLFLPKMTLRADLHPDLLLVIRLQGDYFEFYSNILGVLLVEAAV